MEPLPLEELYRISYTSHYLTSNQFVIIMLEIWALIETFTLYEWILKKYFCKKNQMKFEKLHGVLHP